MAQDESVHADVFVIVAYQPDDHGRIVASRHPGVVRACPRRFIPARDSFSLILRASVHPDVGLSSSKFRRLQDFAASSVTQRRFRTLAKKLTTVTLLSAKRHFISDARRKMVSRVLSDASGRQ